MANKQTLAQAVEEFIEKYEDPAYWDNVVGGGNAKPVWRSEVNRLKKALNRSRAEEKSNERNRR